MRTLKISLLVFILSINISAQWEWKNPLPQANNLKKIFFTDSSTGWMVGDKGTFVKTIDGSEWRAVYFDSIRANLKSISFINKNFGWAVSAVGGTTEEGRVFKTSDAGHNWTQVYFFNKILYDVKFISENIGWVVGFGIISKTTDGGISWNDQLLDPAAKFYSCFFMDSLRGWATGYSGTEVYHTGDGGLTWARQKLDSSATYFSISFADSMNGWIAGSSSSNTASLFRSTDGGLSWFESPISGSGLNTITFLSNSLGWITQGSNILKTSDGGNSWTTISGVGSSIDHIFFVNPIKGWLINPKGIIRTTTDGGFTWITQSSGFRFGASAFFIDSLKGTIIAPGPELWYTQDGGITWTVSWVHAYADYVHKITFIDSLYGWGCGYRHNPYPTQPGPLMLITTNGGQTWNAFQPPAFGIGTHLSILEFPSRQIGFTSCYGIWRTTSGGGLWSNVYPNAGSIYDIFFLNTMLGWATEATGKIYKTTNGGNSWEQITPGITIRKIFFLNENDGWGNNDNGSTLMRTTDGGYTWQVQLPEAVSISDYWIADENNVWLVGGKTLKTTDGGQSWVSFWHPSSYTIYSVQFIKNKLGWFAGGEGTILKYYNDEPSSIETEEIESIILTYTLSQNYPNPFNPVTKIKYTIPASPKSSPKERTFVQLLVYDLLGREVAVLVNEEKQPGVYEIVFDGSKLSSGVYLYRLSAGEFSETSKLVLLK